MRIVMYDRLPDIIPKQDTLSTRASFPGNGEPPNIPDDMGTSTDLSG